jgi:hypothetical protein
MAEKSKSPVSAAMKLQGRLAGGRTHPRFGIGGATAPSKIGKEFWPAEPRVYLPRKMKGGTRQVVTAHELEEATRMKKILGKKKVPGLYEGGIKVKPKGLKGRWEHLKTQLPHVPLRPQVAVAKGQPILRRTPGYKVQRTSHVSPDVLMRESEIVSRMPASTRERMIKIRKETGEARLMKELGLEYGKSPKSRLHRAQIRKAGRKAEITRVPGAENLVDVRKAEQLGESIGRAGKRVGTAVESAKSRFKKMFGLG